MEHVLMKWTVVESHQSLEPFASTSQVCIVSATSSVCVAPYKHVSECRGKGSTSTLR